MQTQIHVEICIGRHISVAVNYRHLLRSVFTASYESILQSKFREFSSLLSKKKGKKKKGSIWFVFFKSIQKYLLSARINKNVESARKFI